MTVTEGDDEQGIGTGSAPIRSECLQGEGATARAGLSLPLVESIICLETEQMRWWLHIWVGLGLTPWVPQLGETGGEQGLMQAPGALLLEKAGGEFISLSEHWHHKGILFCWYLLMTSSFLLLFHLINAISPTGRRLSQNIKMQN